MHPLASVIAERATKREADKRSNKTKRARVAKVLVAERPNIARCEATIQYTRRFGPRSTCGGPYGVFENGRSAEMRSNNTKRARKARVAIALVASVLVFVPTVRSFVASLLDKGFFVTFY